MSIGADGLLDGNLQGRAENLSEVLDELAARSTNENDASLGTNAVLGGNSTEGKRINLNVKCGGLWLGTFSIADVARLF